MQMWKKSPCLQALKTIKTVTHGSSEVDRHERMAGDKEVIQPHDVGELVEHVAVPSDQPTQREDRSYFRSATITYTHV